MRPATDWPLNRLLLALPSEDLEVLTPDLERRACPREQILVDADSELDEVFFPDSGVVSAVAVYADGSIIETATIGREGCTAIQATLGAESRRCGYWSRFRGAPRGCRERLSTARCNRCRRFAL